MKAFIGISINSPYFSHQNLLNYVRYIDGINNLNVSDLAFLIGDTPYALTHSVLNQISISKSHQIVKNKGKDFVRLINNILEKEVGLSFSTRVFTWEDITKCDFYNDLYTKTLRLYYNNSEFKKQIRKQVLLNLEKSLVNKDLNEFEFSLLDYYMIDEIAGLLTMSEHFQYQYEIYPGQDLFILEKIIAREFDLLDKYNREFIELRFL